jgi:IMP dehydrogenase/GMP reductase
MERWLSYDAVSLIPTHVSSLLTRAEADTSVQFGPIKLQVPIIAAPMPDVTNGEMAKKLADLGSFGWIHRFQSAYDQEQELRKGNANDRRRVLTVGLAIPGKPDEALEAVENLDAYGTKIFCIDTANGASMNVCKTIDKLKTAYPDIFLVVGNVASWENFRRVEAWGADAIRVGIAGGSVCETRTETGVYSPMAWTVLECAQRGHTMLFNPNKDKKEPNHALLIADGGIRSPADMCKALALGADLVMVGNAFAGTDEAPGQVLKGRDGKKVKLLRGAASYSVQEGKSEYNEGAETFADYQGSVEKVIKRYAAGLRSSMSYMNSRTLEEYRKNVKVIEI